MIQFYIPTAVFVVINLIVLFFILRKLLFKPVTEFMENRTRSIKESIDNAEKAKAEAGELKAIYEEQLRMAKEEAQSILNAAQTRANNEYDDTVKKARNEAERIMADARAEIEREKETMLAGIKSQVAGLALAVASRVIEANMDSEKNRALVEKFINEVGAA